MSTPDDFDVGVDAPTDRLEALTKALSEAAALKETIEQMEGDLKVAKAGFNQLATERLPDMMSQVNASDMTVDGWQAKLSEFVSGSLPKEEPQKSEALDWLVKNDGEPLIKTVVTIEFGRKEHQDALALAMKLSDMDFEPIVSSGVHPQTLVAFLRERLTNGEEVDFEKLGVHSGQVVKFKRAK